MSEPTDRDRELYAQFLDDVGFSDDPDASAWCAAHEKSFLCLIERVRKEAFEEGAKQVNHAIKLIERAEQRERCASIAWEYGREESDQLYKDFACEVADEIADRIRNASLEPGEQPEQKRQKMRTLDDLRSQR